MEQFFIVTERSELHKDYFDWKDNLEQTRLLINEFFSANNIETKLYGFHGDNLCIVPTENDLTIFNNVLGKELGEKQRPFKSNSKIQKLWLKALEEKGLENKRKPYVPMYFSLRGGKMSSRLFDIDGVLYCSFKNGWDEEVETPLDFKELKASEFWKIVEDYEERNDEVK